MKKTKVKDIELGNLIFGNSRGNYVINRDEWQDPFCDFMSRTGFDAWGYRKNGHDEDPDEQEYDFGFENDTFVLRPYYWGEGDDIAALPNFEYKPTGFTLSWYKYPLRNAFASHNISTERFVEILHECEDSMKGRHENEREK